MALQKWNKCWHVHLLDTGAPYGSKKVKNRMTCSLIGHRSTIWLWKSEKMGDLFAYWTQEHHMALKKWKIGWPVRLLDTGAPYGFEKMKNRVTCSLVGHGSTWEFVIFGMNGVEMKRHGLILWENDATWPKIILEWFPGPNHLLTKIKNTWTHVFFF